MNTPHRRLRRAGSLATVLSLVALGAGGAATSALADPAAVAAASTPALSDARLVVAVPGLPSNIDAHGFDGIPHAYANYWFQGILNNFAPAESSEVTAVPNDTISSLAEDIEIVDDGIIVTLREAMSPAGNVMSADDLAWTLERAVALEERVTLFYMATAGIATDGPLVEVIDDHTAKILGTPTPLAEFVMTRWEVAPMDSALALEHATDSDPWATEWLATNSASYGPYAVEQFTPEQELRLTRNPNYWNIGELAYAEIIVRAVPEAATRVQLLRSGDVDLAYGLSYEQAGELRNVDEVVVNEQATNGLLVFNLNKGFEPFADADVRRAMSMAIDREAILEGPFRGFGKPATSVISSSIIGTEGSGEYYTYDPERAAELLAGSTFPDGFEMTIYATPTESGDADPESVAVLIASQLQVIGIDAQVEIVPSGPDFVAARSDGRYEAFIQSESPLASDAAYQMNLYHLTESTSNFMADGDPDIDAATAEALTLPIGEERNAAMQGAVDVYDDQVYNIPLAEQRTIIATGQAVCEYLPSGRQSIELWRVVPC